MVQDIERSLFFMKYFGISYTEATQTSNKSGKYKLIRRPAPYKNDHAHMSAHQENPYLSAESLLKFHVKFAIETKSISQKNNQWKKQLTCAIARYNVVGK